MGKLLVLAVSAAAKLAVITYLSLWPIRPALERLHEKDFNLRVAWKLYSIDGSNLDVFAASWLLTLLLLVLLWQVRKPRIIGMGRLVVLPPYGKVSHIIHAACTIVQLAMLAKAVVVAVLAEERLWPKGGKSGNVGLLAMYGSVVAALLGSFIEEWAAQGLVGIWRKAGEAARAQLRTGAAEPLLSSIGSGVKAADGSAEQPQRQHKESATVAALVKLATPDTPILLLAFTAGAAAALGQALIPYYTGKIIDYASIDPEPRLFRLTTLRLLGVAAGCALFTGIRGGLFTIAMTRLNVRLRKQLFASLMHQDIAFFDSTKTGEITSRLSADTGAVSDSICLNLNILLRSLTQAAMVMVFMFTASWRLTVVTFVMVPLVIVICKVYGAFYRKMSKRVQTELAEANSVAEEALSTMTTVRAHAAEASTQVAYAAKLHKFYRLQRREAVAYGLYMTTNTFLAAAVVAVVLFYGGSLVLDGAMSAGALVSFMLYQQSLSGAFQALGDVFSALSAAVGAADKVVELMHRQPALPPPGTLAPSSFAGKISLRDVVFSYPGRSQLRVLDNVSIDVAPGMIVALVGPSGGGKSSIVKLVERFYVPQSGTVLIDGQPVGAYQPSWLKRRVALVSQEPVLYARSIRRNIIYGLEEEDGLPPEEVPTQADIEEAARLANAHTFISALPDGYDTEIGEKGTTLSGGQKQRIAIARALVRRPSILLLDEATSALDAESEAVVQEALDRTMKNRTVLVIAHRLSTVREAHRIVVIQHGRVAEVGSHDELLERGGVYASLVRRQLARATSSSRGLERSSSAGSLGALTRP